MNGKLEAGFCSSYLIANAVSYDLDIKLIEWANRNNVSYSRYSDDMTFSSDRRLDFSVEEIKHIVNESGFLINEDKTRYMFRGESQYVTGFSVTKPGHPLAPKSLKSALRKDLYYIGKYGLEDHMLKKYGGMTEESAIDTEIDKLYGMIGYIHGIEPEFIKKLRQKKYLPQEISKDDFIAYCFSAEV